MVSLNRRHWRPWGILASLFLLNAGFFAYSIAPASIFPLFIEAFTIDKPAASTSISAIFLAWAVLQIPGGYVLDRYDNRLLLFSSTALFVISSTAGILVDAYHLFVLTRLISGASAVFIFVGTVNILSHVFDEDRQAIVLSVFIASPPFGIAVAQYSAPLLAEPYGWRMPILVYTLSSVIGLVASYALVRQPVKASGRVSIGQFFGALRNPAIVLVSIASFCTYAVWTFLLTWMPTYGSEVLGIDLAAAGAAAALVPLAGIVSRPGGGWVSEQLGGRIQPVIIGSFLGSILFLYLLSIAPSPAPFAVLLALAGASVNLAVGLYLVYVNSLAELETQGTSFSVLITFSQVGNLVAPVAGGLFIAQISWTAGFAFGGGLAVIGLLSTLIAPSVG